LIGREKMGSRCGKVGKGSSNRKKNCSRCGKLGQVLISRGKEEPQMSKSRAGVSGTIIRL